MDFRLAGGDEPVFSVLIVGLNRRRVKRSAASIGPRRPEVLIGKRGVENTRIRQPVAPRTGGLADPTRTVNKDGRTSYLGGGGAGH